MRISNAPTRAVCFWFKKFPVFDGWGTHTSAMRLSYRSTYFPSLESTGRKSEQPHLTVLTLTHLRSRIPQGLPSLPENFGLPHFWNVVEASRGVSRAGRVRESGCCWCSAGDTSVSWDTQNGLDAKLLKRCLSPSRLAC